MTRPSLTPVVPYAAVRPSGDNAIPRTLPMKVTCVCFTTEGVVVAGVLLVHHTALVPTTSAMNNVPAVKAGFHDRNDRGRGGVARGVSSVLRDDVLRTDAKSRLISATD